MYLRILGLLYGSGSALLGASLLLEGLDKARWVPGMVGPGVIAALASVAILLNLRRLPAAAVTFLPNSGSVLITIVALSAPATTAPAYLFFYFWVVFCSASFLSRRAAAWTLANVMGSVALVVMARPLAGGNVIWALMSGTLVVAGILFSLMRERTREAEGALREAERRFRASFEHAPIGVALCSIEDGRFGRFVAVNRALCEITGRTERDLLARTFAEITHPDDVERNVDAARAFVAGHLSSYVIVKRYVRPDGGSVWVEVSAALIRDDRGEPLYAISHIQDITDRRRFEEDLRHLAEHDALTGLPNRRHFEMQLGKQVAYARRYATNGALILVDVDHFKFVNDEHGHKAGDEVLMAVSDVLREHIRATDVVARLGGDEFALILPSAEDAEARVVARKLLAAIRHLAANRPMPGPITASAGIAVFGPGFTADADQVLMNADVALYQAKEGGRDCARVHAASPGRPRSRTTWTSRLQEALEDDSFVLHAQPIREIASGSVVGHELLLRMQEPGALVPPHTFLPVAERLGFIQSIDRWVIARAAALIARAGPLASATPLHVNLSGRTVDDSGLPGYVEATFEAAGADPAGLVLEVTETAAIADIERARTFCDRMRALGCRMALDDFGSAFGGFYYLKHMPFDFLKIDGEFVAHVPASHRDQVLIRSIVDIAGKFGMATVAEWADNAAVPLLREFGVDYAQGYALGRPAPIDAGAAAEVG